MYCPNCGNKSEGKWCEYCGTRLELDDNYDLSPYRGEEDTNNEDYTPKAAYDYSEKGTSDSTYTDYQKYDNIRDFDPYNDYAEEDDGKKKLIIIISSITAVIAALVIAIIIVFSVNSSPKEEEVILSDAQISVSDELFQKGERYMDMGDYESAEDIFKEIIDTEHNEEAETLYKILYNYNRAVLKLDDNDFKSAKKFCDKIPLDYVDYIISDDVDNLTDEIARYETAYDIFQSISDYMAAGNFTAAEEAMDIIDESVLSSDDKDRLDDFKDEIEKNEENKPELSEHEAESLLREYCESFVKAINSRSFDIVAPYMHSNSSIYKQQKKLIESYINDGITESFDSLRVKSLSKAGDLSWKASVSESETIYYADGRKESKSYNWVYTIEYIDSSFYLTKIEKG